jgi:hypothetical protein
MKAFPLSTNYRRTTTVGARPSDSTPQSSRSSPAVLNQREVRYAFTSMDIGSCW